MKKCLICGNPCTKKGRKYCSKECFSKSKIGNNYGFKKGKTPWNKGTIGVCKPNVGTFKKGQASWRRGLKMTPEQLDKQRETMRNFWDSERGKQTRKKISKTLTGRPTGRTGALSNFWKGGKSSEYTKLKNSLEWKNWRRSVFERDDYTCQECGERNYKGNGKSVWIHPHHIKSRTEFPELQFNVDNGQTLCRDCHRKTHNYGIKAVRSKGSTGATS